MLKLFTDTDTDMTREEAQRLGLGLISMPFTIDGVTTYPYEGESGFDFAPFYEKLREGIIPSTSAIGAERYTSYFEPEFAAGNDILYVHFSRAMSGTFAAMEKAVSALLAKYPERKFYTLDTKMITIGSLAIVRDVAAMIADGKSVEEVLEWAKTEVDHYAVYFFADDLKFFRHSGRVSGIAGTMGTMLGIRPIIYINSEGKMVKIDSEKGRRRAFDRLLAFMDKIGDDVAGHQIIVGHADALELADELVSMIREKYGEVDIDVVNVNPTIGSHCGPNSVGVCFRSTQR